MFNAHALLIFVLPIRYNMSFFDNRIMKLSTIVYHETFPDTEPWKMFTAHEGCFFVSGKVLDCDRCNNIGYVLSRKVFLGTVLNLD